MLTKNTLINLLLVFGSLAAGFLVVEFALHFLDVRFAYLPPLEPPGYLKYDPELGFDITPNFATSTHYFYDSSYSVWSNELGCFDYPYDGVSPYIYVTGDSFAWGFTSLSDKWGKVIEKITGTRALTCGVSGFGTRQEVIKTHRDLARLKGPPKLILVSYFGGNDYTDDIKFPHSVVSDGYRGGSGVHCEPETLINTSPLISTTTCNVEEPQSSLYRNIKFKLYTNSVLFMFAYKKIYQKFIVSIKDDKNMVAQESSISDIQWNAHMRSVSAFKELADMNDTQLLFVLVPMREMTRATSTNPEWANERIKRYLTEYGIQYVDLLPEFRAKVQSIRPNPFYWYNDGHWNVAGNRLAGEIISEYLLTHYPELFQSSTE